MTIVGTTARTLSASLSLPRLLAVLALAAALVAIPAISPDAASARRTSEKAAQRACSFLGGDVSYEFPDQDVMTVFSMSCQTWWGGDTTFKCNSYSSGPFANIVDCNY